MKNIAIIPARSGSKGLKNKNIKLLNGIPLIGYSIRSAKESEMFSHIMVSTDSLEYAKIAQDFGAEVPFFRSAPTSGDNASSWDVVKEVLEGYSEKFDTVCLLQPTSPLRKAEDIIAGYKCLIGKKADAITSVCEMEHSPIWAMTLNDEHSMEEFRKNFKDCPRQKLKKYYRINGAIYIRKVLYKRDEVITLCEKEYAYVMDRNRSIDIDVEEDFEMAEFFLKKFEKF